MSDFNIVPLDPNNHDMVESWIECSQVTDTVDYPFMPPISAFGLRAMVYTPDSQSWTQRYVALDNSRVVGMVATSQDLLNNTDKAFLGLRVHPDYRRQGIGTRLYRVAEDSLRKAGIATILGGYGDNFRGLPQDDELPDTEDVAIDPEHGKPGREFARLQGFKVGTQLLRRICDLKSVDHEHFDALSRELASAQGDYDLVTYAQYVNDEDVADYCRLRARTVADAPNGDMEFDGMEYSVEQWRTHEKHAVDSGNLRLGVYALHRDTTVVAGLSEIDVRPGQEYIAHQSDTVVDPDHRGNKLGLSLKIAIMRHLLQWRPQVRYINTYNNHENRHMVAVNDQIGFQTYCTDMAVQKSLTA